MVSDFGRFLFAQRIVNSKQLGLGLGLGQCMEWDGPRCRRGVCIYEIFTRRWSRKLWASPSRWNGVVYTTLPCTIYHLALPGAINGDKPDKPDPPGHLTLNLVRGRNVNYMRVAKTMTGS